MACRLPGRPAILGNDQWEPAILELETELKTCAAQVLACMQQQAPAWHPPMVAPKGMPAAAQGVGSSGG